MTFVHRHRAYIVVDGDSVESFDGGFWHLIVSLVFPDGDKDGILGDGVDVGTEDVFQVFEWLFDATGFHPLVVDCERFCIGHTAKVDTRFPDGRGHQSNQGQRVGHIVGRQSCLVPNLVAVVVGLALDAVFDGFGVEQIGDNTFLGAFDEK